LTVANTIPLSWLAAITSPNSTLLRDSIAMRSWRRTPAAAIAEMRCTARSRSAPWVI
jgi:hypothetical protein